MVRKALFGTTVLAAAGFAAGGAKAGSALELGISGFYRNSIGMQWGDSPSAVTAGGSFVGYGDTQRQTASMRQEIRVNFSGETQLDNGITVGVLVGLDGENVAKSNDTDQIYESYAYFSGRFGEIRIGEVDSALVTSCVLDPGNVTSNFGVNSPWESYSNVGRSIGPPGSLPATQGIGSTFGVAPVGSIGTCYGIELQANKIEYFSPTFGGLSFAVSFAPQGNSRFAGGGITYGTDVSSDPVDNVLSTYASYADQLGDWSITAGLGGEWSFTSLTAAGASTGDKAAMYSGGIQAGTGDWSFGASGAYYQNYSNNGYAATLAAPSDDAWVVTAGLSRSIGDLSVGLEGMYSRWQELAGATDEVIAGVSLNASYMLATGVSLEAQLAYTYADYGNVGWGGAPIPVVDGVELDFGTDIGF